MGAGCSKIRSASHKFKVLGHVGVKGDYVIFKVFFSEDCGKGMRRCRVVKNPYVEKFSPKEVCFNIKLKIGGVAVDYNFYRFTNLMVGARDVNADIVAKAQKT